MSTDIVHSPASCTFDSQLTMVSGSFAKFFGWYDNEWGYSCRLVDLVEAPVKLPRSVESADVAGEGRARPLRPQRPARGRPRRRRHAHPRIPPDDPPAARPRCCGGSGLLAPRTAEDGEDRASTRSRPCAPRLREPVGDDRVRCSRTRASTRARRRTTRVRQATRGGLRPLCRRRIRFRPPGPRLDRGRGRAPESIRRGCCCSTSSRNLGRLLGEVEHPFVIVAGGAKVDDKLGRAGAARRHARTRC